MKRLLEDRVALITGGSSGIGRATALAFAREGAKVIVVADINMAGLDQTVQEVKEQGGDACAFEVDISKASQVAALVEKLASNYGRIDCAFNNAGVDGGPCPLVGFEEDTWAHVVDVNLKGTWLCMKYEIQQMLQQGGGGAIVNTSSVVGQVGLAGYSSYVASKHGVLGLTKTAAIEYSKEKIRINAVCPGPIETPMLDRLIGGDDQVKQMILAQVPTGRFGRPEEVAEAVVWLCSDRASFVTGSAMAVDGGLMA